MATGTPEHVSLLYRLKVIVPVGFEPSVRWATSAIDWPTIAALGVAVVVIIGWACTVTVSLTSAQPLLSGVLFASPP